MRLLRIWAIVLLFVAASVGFLAVAVTGVRYEDGHAEYMQNRIEEAVKNGVVLDQDDVRRIANDYPNRTDPYETFSWKYFSAAFRQASLLMAVSVLIAGVALRIKAEESVIFGLLFILLVVWFSASLATYFSVIAAALLACFISHILWRTKGRIKGIKGR